MILFLYEKLGNIEYDTKKNGEDILSRRRRLLSTIWMKYVPVAPRYQEFRLGVKKFAFELPKVPDMAKYVKKTPQIALLLRQRGVRRIKLLHGICLLFSSNFVEVIIRKKKN